MTSRITTAQQRVLQFIQDFQARQGSAPTRAEISSEFGWRSGNSAEEHLQRLRRGGYLEIVPGTARGLRFTDKGRAALDALATSSPGAVVASLSPPARPDRQFIALPLITRAIRGVPLIDQVRQRGGDIEALPDGAFKDSGTGVRTVIVTIPGSGG